MSKRRVYLVGDGWGAVSACRSLLGAKFDVYAISNDDNVKKLSVPHLIASIEEIKNECIVFAGYKPIVPKFVLEKNVCINIHYSLLPSYRGLHSTVWAILNDEQYLGLTIHKMNEFIDDGPIIYQYSIANDFVSTSVDYMELFNKHIEDCLGLVLVNFLDGKILPQEQNKGNASWVGRRSLKDCLIDWSQTIAYQKAFFRALVDPYPLPYFVFMGAKYTVARVDFQISLVNTHIGRILNIDSDGVWVKVKDGYMVLKTIYDRNGNEVDYNNFRIGMYL